MLKQSTITKIWNFFMESDDVRPLSPDSDELCQISASLARILEERPDPSQVAGILLERLVAS